MITQNRNRSDKKTDSKNEQAKNIISGSAHDDQQENLKHGEKSKKVNRGSGFKHCNNNGMVIEKLTSDVAGILTIVTP